MQPIRLLALPLLAGALALPVGAQQVGSKLPEKLSLEGFSQTPADSFGDFYGRSVLIEFFAYW